MRTRHVQTELKILGILVVIVASLFFLINRLDNRRQMAVCPRPPIQSYYDSTVYVTSENNQSINNGVYIKDNLGISRLIARKPNMHYSSPSWSPKGDLIVFIAGPIGEDKRGVWTIRPDGTKLQLVATFVDDWQHPDHPQISPDSDYIIFDTYSGIAETDLATLHTDWILFSNTERMDPVSWYYFTRPSYVGSGGAFSYKVVMSDSSMFGYFDEGGGNWRLPQCR